MADIFISYANEDRDRAAQLAELLESEGWPVWWDRRIPAGRTWRSVLEDALENTRCMIVLWSENSVKSPWVAEEAEEARRLGKTLVPVLIQRVEPPMGFRAIQAADLVHWDGSRHDAAARQLIADLKSLLFPRNQTVDREMRDIEPQPKNGFKTTPWLTKHWPKAAFGIAAVAALVAVWQTWPNFKPSSPMPRSSREERSSENPVVPSLTNLSVSAERRTIKPAETLKLALKGHYSDGSQKDLSDGVEWSSSDTRIATVDQRGEVKALQAGTTKIIAKVGGVESSEWTLGVENVKLVAKPVAVPKLVGLNVSSSKQELVESEKIALRARGRYSDNSERYLSSGIEWEVSDRTIAAVNENGELVARRPGKIRVVARSNDLSSAPVTFLIREARRNLETPAKPVKTAEPAPAKLPTITEQAKGRILGHIDRARSFREQGNYVAALAELEKAKAIDAVNEEIRKEIDQTKRACNAEKVLGNKPNC
jgi:TIR domain-containing protein/Big-like domain-containing protein